MDTWKQACWLTPLETIVKRLQPLIIHGYITPQRESVCQGRRHPKVQMRQCGRIKRRKAVRWTVDLLGPYWHDIEAKVIAADPTCTRFMRLTGLVSRSSLFQDKKPVWNLSTCKVSLPTTAAEIGMPRRRLMQWTQWCRARLARISHTHDDDYTIVSMCVALSN